MKSSDLRGAIEALMRKNNWSQNDAAKHYRVTQSTVFRWLQGTVDPRPNALQQMVIDAGDNAELRRAFERRLGKDLAQMLREQAQTVRVDGTLSKTVLENPANNLDRLYVGLYHLSLKIYRDAMWGDESCAAKLRDAFKVLSK